MEELIIDKKKAIKYLIIIILILIGIRVYFGYQKEDFFMDETFSYTLMNMKEGAGMVQTAPEFNNKWISSDKIKNITPAFADSEKNFIILVNISCLVFAIPLSILCSKPIITSS